MKKKNLAIALAVTSIAMLSGCGSSGNGSNNNMAGYTYQCNSVGQCSYVYTGSGGCIPLSSPINFGGSALYTSSGFTSSTLIAGQVPGGTAYGSLSVSTGAVSVGGGMAINSVSDMGTGMQASLTGTTTLGATGQSAVSISGVLQLSSLIQQQIAYYTQGIGGYTGSTGYAPFTSPYSYGASTSCVSAIALQGYVLGGYDFQGTAYLYLNGTTHGWALPLY